MANRYTLDAMEYSARRPPDPRDPVKLSYEPIRPLPSGDAKLLGPLFLAASAVAGACYLLLILTLRQSSSAFANTVWDIGVGLVLLVPVAAGAGLTLGWRHLFARRFRWKEASVFSLASVALLLYTAFWVIARITY